MRRVVLAVLASVLLSVALVSPLAVQAAPKGGSGSSGSGTTCNLPESDAEALVILNNIFGRGYTWDHTDLTVAVQAQPGVTEEHLEAIHDAIATWDATLEKCFDGLITLTDVTDGRNAHQAADIVLHYVRHAGGAAFAGVAICGPDGCSNVLVSSEAPPSFGQDPYTPEFLGWLTLHELGHALGLGHATNLFESTDLMGYGWIIAGSEPVLSDCDLDALAFVFAWALEGSDPYPPAQGPYDCSLD